MISTIYIDNDPYVAIIVSRLCERCGGVTMHPLFSGKEAVKWLSRHPVDVIVSEYNMPGMNGIELLKILMVQGNSTPFIIFTDAGNDKVAEEAAVSGVFGYLLKNEDIRKQIPNLVEMIAEAAAPSVERSGGMSMKWK